MNTRSNTPSPVPKPGQVLRAALVGSGISASLTPAMHEAEGKYHGLEYTYSRFDTALPPYRNQKLADIVFRARDDGLAGMNVTHPFKVEILDIADELSDHVNALGASNTIVFTDNGIVAHSTDYGGFFYGFERDLQGCGKNRVLLIGAGGGGSAVAFALASLGIAELLVYDIDPAHARDLVARLGTHARGMEARVAAQLDVQTMAGIDGVVNATPVGMASHPGSAIDPELLTPELWVSDIVYFPLETELLKTARARGCRVMNGSGMAVYQAVRSFELFSGIKADTRRFEAKFEQLVAARNS